MCIPRIEFAVFFSCSPVDTTCVKFIELDDVHCIDGGGGSVLSTISLFLSIGRDVQSFRQLFSETLPAMRRLPPLVKLPLFGSVIELPPLLLLPIIIDGLHIGLNVLDNADDVDDVDDNDDFRPLCTCSWCCCCCCVYFRKLFANDFDRNCVVSFDCRNVVDNVTFGLKSFMSINFGHAEFIDELRWCDDADNDEGDDGEIVDIGDGCAGITSDNCELVNV